MSEAVELQLNHKHQILAILPDIIEMHEKTSLRAVFEYLIKKGALSCAFPTFKNNYYQLRKGYKGHNPSNHTHTSDQSPGLGISSLKGEFDIEEHQALANSAFEAQYSQ